MSTLLRHSSKGSNDQMTKQLHKKEETTHESRKRWSNKPVNVNTPHLGCAPNMADHIWIAASRQMQTYSVHSRRWNPKPWRPNPCTAAAATTHKLPHAAQQCVHMTGVLQVYVLQVCYRCITGVLQVYYRCMDYRCITGVCGFFVQACLPPSQQCVCVTHAQSFRRVPT